MSTHTEINDARSYLNAIAANGGPNPEYLANPDRYLSEDVLDAWIVDGGSGVELLVTYGGPTVTYVVRDFASTVSDWVVVYVAWGSDKVANEFYAPELARAVQAYVGEFADSLRWECNLCSNKWTQAEDESAVQSIKSTGFCEGCALQELGMSIYQLKEVNPEGYETAVERLVEQSYESYHDFHAEVIGESAERGAARVLIGDESAQEWDLPSEIKLELSEDSRGRFSAVLVGQLSPANAPALPWPVVEQDGERVEFYIDCERSRYYEGRQTLKVAAVLERRAESDGYYYGAEWSIGDEDTLHHSLDEQVDFWGVVVLTDEQRRALVDAIDAARAQAEEDATDEQDWLHSEDYLAAEADDADRKFYWDGSEA